LSRKGDQCKPLGRGGGDGGGRGGGGGGSSGDYKLLSGREKRDARRSSKKLKIHGSGEA
jgi:hypothetical protein